MSLLEIENLSLTIGATPILRGVELTIAPGEVVGLVGESGSGKSMTALTIMRLLPHLARAEGRVTFDGIDILAATEDQMCALRGDDIGMVFQEPMTALNPVKTIGEQVAEGIRWHTKAGRAEAEERARKILDRVGLPEAKFPLSRYPHELSGGQNQRVGLARAMIVGPRLLVCDEAVSALDVSIQAQIVALIGALQAETGLSLIFISHDLSVVRRLSHRVMVLYLGRVVELAPSTELYARPRHPYTKALLSAVLAPDPRAERARKRELLTGDLPSPLDPRAQLTFLKSRLGEPGYRPKLEQVVPGHFVAEHD